MKCPDCGCENIAGEEICESCSAPLASLALPEAKAKKEIQKKLLEGTISELGFQDMDLLAPDASVAQAIRAMRQRKSGCVLVGEKNKLMGICTERDILLKVAGLRNPEEIKLFQVMAPNPHILREDDAVSFAFHNMALRGYRHVPIQKNNGGFGMVSSRDLLRYLCK